ncbi:hypothetical protein NP233_g3123 [Leucocoprinus birnbaumii]|uniref:Uncharacterized protein n=1 Tax=Leucocoprinus birnbaumii TaxID=56174 RepID=A0AAD5VZP6_9AGAR|nr:hypothetical protein NP233_g3123 [Leucocoprinus birnbaumii]
MSLALRVPLTRSAGSLPPRRLHPRRGLLTLNFGSASGEPGGSRRLIVLSAFLGGATVTAVGGYAFYHWSGLKTAVDIVRHPIAAFKRFKMPRDAAIESELDVQAETSAQVLAALRQIAKIYVSPIPGAGILVDLAFNEIEKAVEAHKDEAGAILRSAFNEVQEAIKARGGNTKEAAWDVLAILRDKLGQIQDLTSAAGRDRIGPIFESIPGFHEHAPRYISGVRDSLLPTYQMGLEKGKGVLLGLSRRLKPTTSQEDSVLSAVEPASPSPPAQKEDNSQETSSEQSSLTQASKYTKCLNSGRIHGAPILPLKSRPTQTFFYASPVCGLGWKFDISRVFQFEVSPTNADIQERRSHINVAFTANQCQRMQFKDLLIADKVTFDGGSVPQPAASELFTLADISEHLDLGTYDEPFPHPDSTALEISIEFSTSDQITFPFKPSSALTLALALTVGQPRPIYGNAATLIETSTYFKDLLSESHFRGGVLCDIYDDPQEVLEKLSPAFDSLPLSDDSIPTSSCIKAPERKVQVHAYAIGGTAYRTRLVPTTACSPKLMYRSSDYVRMSLDLDASATDLYTIPSYDEIIEMEAAYLLSHFLPHVSSGIDASLELIVNGLKPHYYRTVAFTIKRLYGEDVTTAWRNTLRHNGSDVLSASMYVILSIYILKGTRKAELASIPAPKASLRDPEDIFGRVAISWALSQTISQTMPQVSCFQITCPISRSWHSRNDLFISRCGLGWKFDFIREYSFATSSSPDIQEKRGLISVTIWSDFCRHMPYCNLMMHADAKFYGQKGDAPAIATGETSDRWACQIRFVQYSTQYYAELARIRLSSIVIRERPQPESYDYSADSELEDEILPSPRKSSPPCVKPRSEEGDPILKLGSTASNSVAGSDVPLPFEETKESAEAARLDAQAVRPLPTRYDEIIELEADYLVNHFTTEGTGKGAATTGRGPSHIQSVGEPYIHAIALEGRCVTVLKYSLLASLKPRGNLYFSPAVHTASSSFLAKYEQLGRIPRSIRLKVIDQQRSSLAEMTTQIQKTRQDQWDANPARVTSYFQFSLPSWSFGSNYYSPTCGFGWRFYASISSYSGNQATLNMFWEPYHCAGMSLKLTQSVQVSGIGGSQGYQNTYNSYMQNGVQTIVSGYRVDRNSQPEVTVSLLFDSSFSLCLPELSAPPPQTKARAVLLDLIRISSRKPSPADTKIYLYSAKKGHRAARPKPLFGNSNLLRDSATYWENMLSEIGFKHGVPCDLFVDDPEVLQKLSSDDYDYDSDSDLDSIVDEQDPGAEKNITAGMSGLSIDENGDKSKASSSTPVSDAKVSTAPGLAYAVNGTAYRTMEAYIIFAYTGEIEFEPLGSSKRLEMVRGTRKSSSEVTGCSPKSMYRFADYAGIPGLKAKAKTGIEKGLTKENIVSELFSSFTSKYDDIIEMETEFLIKNFTDEVERAFNVVLHTKEYQSRTLIFALKRLRGGNVQTAWDMVNSSTTS